MKKVLSIAGLILTTCLSHISAQRKIIVAPLYPLTKSSKFLLASPKEVTAPVYLSSYPVTENRGIATTKSPLAPNDYYQQHFGFFCKKEWNWEKQTQLPVKLRLGSYQEAQRLEGK
ncbi:hypothetical protein [Chitinophaga ginsengisoli]|uniref:Uncharacterized protein n=1 Tax=Chitinophaga ginsengisoli TaxID=363837 RepID=A0A2P8GNG0_9BACT|nr:hypothetical protein [Chitinophaga ginsengisoli]PSL35501.1 hypothetical protein CLV42_101261 [Chitinophaga ginsengisoli]